MSDLFANHINNSNAILLVDASGSTVINKFNGELIFDKIKNIISTLEEEKYRIIFWNSDIPSQNVKTSFFAGIYKLPFFVTKNTMGIAFQTVKPNINNNCLTFPHLGFDGIPDEWIDARTPTKIYFVTDGEMGYGNISSYELRSLKTALVDSIKRLFGKYSNIQLHIITVEPNDMDFTQIETLNRAAGCDVYNVIMENHLTKFISKFISYSPNNLEGFIHINKNIPPPGFIPYEDKYFSELRTNEFLEYIYHKILETSDENDLLKIVQSLSSTVCALIVDKPTKIVSEIIKTFCNLFNKTTLDSMFVLLILEDAVKKENDGMANVFASYRAKLRDLYKQANNLLSKNVKEAVGINNFCVGLPIDGKIVSGHYRLIEKNVLIDNINYPQSALLVNDILVPVFPFDLNDLSPMNEQCLRQWIRILIHKMYGVNAMEDIVIHIVLSIVLRVVLSDVDESLKKCYRQLGTIMLKKKRTNTDITELSRLEDGQLPTPNSGKMESFYGYMETIKRQLNLNVKPMTLWYALCLALDNPKLITKQLMHCKDFIEEDFTGCEPQTLLQLIKNYIKPITYHKIPFESILDYTCVITMDDTSETGGYCFLPHKTLQKSICSPIFVLSDKGYNNLLTVPETSRCPICFTKLNANDFQKVKPNPLQLSELDIFQKDTINIFNSGIISLMSKMTINNNNNSNIVSQPMTKNYKIIKTGTLVIMKGTVGSGKSTYSAKLREALEVKGYHCIVVGTDKYCKMGIPFGQAISMVHNELLEINTVNDKPIVVIIDTCGEKNNKNNIFGLNFSNWKSLNIYPNRKKSDMEGYLAWSLRNVLLRNKPDELSNHYLNPETVGIETCIDIHARKAKALFGKKIPKITIQSLVNRELVINDLSVKADKYQELLNETMSLESEIEKIVELITG